MPPLKKPDALVTARSPRASIARDGEPRAVAIPRPWLVCLLILFVAPWLVVGSIYVRGPEPILTSARAAPPATVAAAAGPWGQLAVTPIIVSPPLEYVPADWVRRDQPYAWYFPETSPDLLATFLNSTGLPPEQIARLRAAARPEPRIRGLILVPDPEVIRTMTPEVRARVYTELAKTSLNADQANAFRFSGPSIDEWLEGSLISADTRRLIEPLIYRHGASFHFGDAEFVRTQIKDEQELQYVAKVLLRQSTLLVQLAVSSPSEVAGLAEYWGRGGRRTDVRPLLESVADTEDGRTIDIVHLLPSFARNHLYRYPKVSTGDYEKPLLANCLWSALNFFRAVPEDRFLDVGVAISTLRNEYYVVQHGYQLGDIVALLDREGNLFHVAVYIADDLVFTKNGTSPVAPWAIMPLPQVLDFYRVHESNPRLIYHRRNDL